MDEEQGTELKGLLEDFLSGTKGMKGTLVCTRDGLLTCGVGALNDPDALAAILSSAIGIGQHAAEHSSLGAFSETILKAEEGFLAVVAIGDSHVLGAVCSHHNTMGMVVLKARRTAQRIKNEVQ